MNIEELMFEYFSNKDRIKQLKLERKEYSEANKCEGDYSCFHSGELYGDICEACKGKHPYYVEIKRLAHRNTTIMNRLRKLTYSNQYIGRKPLNENENNVKNL